MKKELNKKTFEHYAQIKVEIDNKQNEKIIYSKLEEIAANSPRCKTKGRVKEARTHADKNEKNPNIPVRSICVEDPRNCPLTKHRGLPGDIDLA